ncbi:MAG TPA: CoA-binding protein [Williamwhitmania sp.]|nr:CoA-binding protein [Williamwhitmania sp.]
MEQVTKNRMEIKEQIDTFLRGKTIAVAGVSRHKKKFGYLAYLELKEAGYKVFPINPNMAEIDGEHCYPRLSSIEEQVDSLLVCTESVGLVVDEAVALGIQNIWLQNGINADKLGNLAILGISLVQNECILMYAVPRKFPHNLHRFIRKTFGTLHA